VDSNIILNNELFLKKQFLFSHHCVQYLVYSFNF
jgi:hypothetical protein